MSKETYPIIILYSIMAVFLMFAYAYYANHLNVRFKKMITWFANQSFIIYLVHLLVIRSFLAPLPQWIGYSLWQGVQGKIFFIIATVLVSTCFAYLISLTPFATFLGGVRGKRRHFSE